MHLLNRYEWQWFSSVYKCCFFKLVQIYTEDENKIYYKPSRFAEDSLKKKSFSVCYTMFFLGGGQVKYEFIS